MGIAETCTRMNKVGAMKKNLLSKVADQTKKTEELRELVSKPKNKAEKDKILNTISNLEKYVKSNPNDLNARLRLSTLKEIISN